MPPQAFECEDYEVILTFLPNGWRGRKLAGSVHLAPRLKCSGTLGQYANSFADWPRILQSMKWRFCCQAGSAEVDRGATPRTVSIDRVGPSAVDSRLWKAIFPPTQQYEDTNLMHRDTSKKMPTPLSPRHPAT